MCVCCLCRCFPQVPGVMPVRVNCREGFEVPVRNREHAALPSSDAEDHHHSLQGVFWLSSDAEDHIGGCKKSSGLESFAMDNQLVQSTADAWGLLSINGRASRWEYRVCPLTQLHPDVCEWMQRTFLIRNPFRFHLPLSRKYSFSTRSVS